MGCVWFPPQIYQLKFCFFHKLWLAKCKHSILAIVLHSHFQLSSFLLSSLSAASCQDLCSFIMIFLFYTLHCFVLIKTSVLRTLWQNYVKHKWQICHWYNQHLLLFASQIKKNQPTSQEQELNCSANVFMEDIFHLMNSAQLFCF